jgi:hypothetical protein
MSLTLLPVLLDHRIELRTIGKQDVILLKQREDYGKKSTGFDSVVSQLAYLDAPEAQMLYSQPR